MKYKTAEQEKSANTHSRQEKIKMQMDQQELYHLLKYGRNAEIQAFCEQQKKESYPREFSPFMEQMIKEHKVSRKDVAVRSGLSQDYLYKLLRGDKHTDERDYIIAMCMAIGMNLPQTQHALFSYGMSKLTRSDIRGSLIMSALEHNADIDELDDMLEKVGLPLIKVNPDMPSAPVISTFSSFDQNDETRVFQGKRREFIEIDSFTDGHHNGGNAPFDYDYQGWIKVQDEDGQIYQVEAIFKSEYSSFLVFTEEQRKEAEKIMELRQQREADFYDRHKDILEPVGGQINPFTQPELYDEFISLCDDIPEAEMLEYYDCIEDAAASEFFTYFLEIDKRTDKKVQEVMSKLDDTREYGLRVGSSWSGDNQPKNYIEMFNTQQPELREYFQIREYKDGTCRYTATHESCFMQMEMGQELYKVYFGNKHEAEYFIDTDRNDFTGSEVRFRFIFNAMKVKLHELLPNGRSLVNHDNQNVLADKVEYLIQQGVVCLKNGNSEAAVPLLKDAIAAIESDEDYRKSNCNEYVCTCMKLAGALEDLDILESKAWLQKIIDLHDAVVKAYDTDPEPNKGAIYVLASAEMQHYCEAWTRNDLETAKMYVSDILDLIENHNACQDEWDLQFNAYGRHAVLIEDENLDKSLSEYRKALTIARNHHLDQRADCALNFAIQNNNYAWVLWNKCGSEEAILYYGRAIDLLEGYLFSGIVEHDTAVDTLKHVGNALNGIYIDTDRPKESMHLKERLAENGIVLE